MAFGQVPAILSRVFQAPFNEEDGGTIPDPGETFFFLLEDGVSRFLLEDGSGGGRFLKEDAPD